MLTSVVQVPASIGAAHDLASRSTGVRRARARPPSAILAVTVSRTMLVAMDRSAGTVKRTRASMVDVLEAPAMVANKSLNTVVRTMAVKNNPDTVANKRVMADAQEAQDTAANRSPLDMVARKSPDTKEATVASKRARAMAASPLLTTKVVTAEDAATVKSPSVTTGCQVVSAGSNRVAAVTMMMSMVAAGRRVAATAKAVTEVVAMGRRAMAADIRVRER